MLSLKIIQRMGQPRPELGSDPSLIFGRSEATIRQIKIFRTYLKSITFNAKVVILNVKAHILA